MNGRVDHALHSLPHKSPAWLAAWRLLCCGVALAPFVLQAQEWTRFRGPNGTGVSESDGIPIVWQPQESAWRATLPGAGHSSPVLWGDQLFVTSANAESGERYLTCFHADTGAQLWNQTLDGKPYEVHFLNTFATSTPCVDERGVYVVWGTPQELILLALDHAGKELWRRDFGPFQSQHGYGNSPILMNGLVILVNDQCKRPPLTGESSFVAVQANTGETLWTLPRVAREESYSCPNEYVNPQGERELIFNTGANGITSVNALTGKINWEAPGLFELRSVSSSVQVAGLLLGSCGSGAGGNYLVAVAPPTAGKAAQVVYTIKDGAPYVPTAVTRDELLFLWADNGIVSCFNGATGTEHWRQRVGGNYYGSPIRVQDRLYCISKDGVVQVVSASQQFKVLGKVDLGEESNSTPAVARGRMYLRTKTQLFAVGTGQENSGQ